VKPLLVSSGEPAGIGPDICLSLAKTDYPVVIIGNKQLLQQRATQLKLAIQFNDYDSQTPFVKQKNSLTILSLPCPEPVTAGQLNPDNAAYVLEMLSTSIQLCINKEFSGLVTAPVHKAVINQYGIPFTGHTEYLADHCQVKTVVMMLACPSMKVALITTHLPLHSVPAAITSPLIIEVITELNNALKKDFGIPDPLIYVAGLNPHAGEGGYLGREEIDIINPAISRLQEQGINIAGPFPADTMFAAHSLNKVDAYVAMYHDQGLPVLKYAGFGEAVNVTLGLPIIRTSVDHGTALELAGTGKAESSSLIAAVQMAFLMVNERKKYGNN